MTVHQPSGPYSVTVSVSDGKDADGDPDNDAFDDSIAVTIIVENDPSDDDTAANDPPDVH